MTEQAGFAERERRARAAWEFFSELDADDMTHDFRGGYHQGVIDGFGSTRAALNPAVVLAALDNILEPMTTHRMTHLSIMRRRVQKLRDQVAEYVKPETEENQNADA